MNRRFKSIVPHQKVTTDTSEFKIYMTDKKGNISIKKAYLDVFFDLFNGEIISYRLSEKPNFQAIQKALEEAIRLTNDCQYRRKFHSDQGWAYQMKKYSQTLKKARSFQSMS